MCIVIKTAWGISLMSKISLSFCGIHYIFTLVSGKKSQKFFENIEV